MLFNLYSVSPDLASYLCFKTYLESRGHVWHKFLLKIKTIYFKGEAINIKVKVPVYKIK